MKTRCLYAWRELADNAQPLLVPYIYQICRKTKIQVLSICSGQFCIFIKNFTHNLQKRIGISDFGLNIFFFFQISQEYYSHNLYNVNSFYSQILSLKEASWEKFCKLGYLERN